MLPQGSGGKLISLDASDFKKPDHWRERMAQRQKFWSHATGFKMGRKLADWGRDKKGTASGSMPESEDVVDLDEDDQIKQAIALSLAQDQDSEGALLPGCVSFPLRLLRCS